MIRQIEVLWHEYQDCQSTQTAVDMTISRLLTFEHAGELSWTCIPDTDVFPLVKFGEIVSSLSNFHIAQSFLDVVEVCSVCVISDRHMSGLSDVSM